VAALDRQRIRHEFERHFSSTAMANHYLRVYRRLAGRAIRPSDFKYAG
jgi:hypothetical protein